MLIWKVRKVTKTYRVVTGKVRFSYVNVFAPVAQDEGKAPKYSVALIIPKTDIATISRINHAVNSCKKDNMDLWDYFDNKQNKIVKIRNMALLRGGLRDGDVEKSDAAYHGSMFINATSTARPGLVDKDLNDIVKPTDFYSGCYGRASLTFYAYNNGPYAMGIGCTINNLQKLEDGPRLGSFSTPAEDFL